MESFPLLNIWSAYSLLRSSWDIDKGLAELKRLGYRTVGLADFQSLAAAELFSRRAAHLDMATWLGMTVALAPDLHVMLYAQSPDGWQLLCTMVQEGVPTELDRLASPHLLLVLPAASYEDQRLWPAVKALKFGGLVEELRPEQASHGLPWIPACPVRYHAGEEDAYQILMHMGEHLPQPGACSASSPQSVLAPYPVEWRPLLFQELPPSVLPQERARLPVFLETPSQDQEQLVYQAKMGLNAWNPTPKEPYEARLQHELNIIVSMGYASYFLIVADLVQYARTHGILTGPGRGSAAGSLVARCLGITSIDPIEHGLLFERFLNPHRRTLPDIDLDVDFTKRYQLIEYLRQRWGTDRVAQIGTYGTLGARAVLRDVARVLQIPAAQVNAVMANVPQTPGLRLEEIAGDLKPRTLAIDPSGRWWRVSRALEGLPRHSSIHAAGVVLSDRPLAQLVPCVKGPDGHLVTQMDMVSVEKLGLLKLDVLGLRALSVAERIGVSHQHGFNTVDGADPLTLGLLARGDTDAVFQLDGHGVRELMQRMKPRHAKEIIDVVALYRPGPMDAIGTYLARRAGQEPVPHDIFGTVCHDTYGVMVYQEQLMQLVQTMAGYTLAEADLFRRAISKKDHATLSQMEGDFTARAQGKQWSREEIREIWGRIMAFADYGFNKSHAAAYGLFSYYMAYLKAHYPVEFWAAEFSTIGVDKLTQEAKRAVSQGIVLWPPDVTRSHVDFVAEPSGIVAGLTLIRGVSPEMAQRIIAERERKSFQSKSEAFERISRVTQSRIAELVAASGALGRLPGRLLKTGQLSLFDTEQDASLQQVDAVQSFGMEWPVAQGPIYIRTTRRLEDVSWWQRQLKSLQRDFPGPHAVIVGNDQGKAFRVDGIRLQGSWQSLQALRALPMVSGCGRRIETKRVWTDGQDITRGTD
ncbi:hypothetical protein BXT84_11235 [Sulfobacillus thermotolerans]|uniref:DNA-directed DNA polymerase n=1 Tax=Sulfobacillus thermotolerans TaxID=338644 RepID=A0ABM6RSJ8_9FIRM|nr:hypothetical protein BXT84_11235 [Sulfobacillus thermotolerans]